MTNLTEFPPRIRKLIEQRTKRAIKERGELRVYHSMRFRKVSNANARAVAEAYSPDVARAAGDTDAEVAAKVRDWEIANGIEPRDWVAIGREERGEE